MENGEVDSTDKVYRRILIECLNYGGGWNVVESFPVSKYSAAAKRLIELAEGDCRGTFRITLRA